MHNTAKQNYPGSVASYDTPRGNEVGLCYSAHEPSRGDMKSVTECFKSVATYNKILGRGVLFLITAQYLCHID